MCLADPDVRIGFALSDIDGAKKEILEKATKDALEKANILCNAANVKLGQLLSIDYSWDEISFEAHDKFRMSDLSIGGEEASFDFEPDDIKASDTVEFTWEIK
ncbi:SIMPL domain-containing protein [Selenomonas ruminantium]